MAARGPVVRTSKENCGPGASHSAVGCSWGGAPLPGSFLRPAAGSCFVIQQGAHSREQHKKHRHKWLAFSVERKEGLGGVLGEGEEDS